MKTVARFLAIILVVAMALPLSACGEKVEVMEYNGHVITSEMYSYILSENKSYILSQYNYTDSPEIWNSAYSDDVTVGEWLVSQVNDYCRTLLVCKDLATKNGISLSEESVTALEKLNADLIEAYGGKGKWNVYLASFGINVDIFNEYMEMRYLMFDVYDALVSDGTISCEDQEIYEYFKDYYKDYNLVRHILFNYQFKYTDEDGKKVSLTDEQKAEKLAEYTDLAEKMQAGEASFEDYIEKNEDSGVYYLVTDDNRYVEEFQDAALEMEIGEYRVVETKYGYHLMNKLELTQEVYDEEFSEKYSESIRSGLMTDKFYAILDESAQSVSVNSEELSRFDIITAPVMS